MKSRLNVSGYVKGASFFNGWYPKGYLFCKKWYIKGAVLRDIHLPSGVGKSKTRNEVENYPRCVHNNNIFIVLRVQGFTLHFLPELLCP